jgi:hypothetical protein
VKYLVKPSDRAWPDLASIFDFVEARACEDAYARFRELEKAIYIWNDLRSVAVPTLRAKGAGAYCLVAGRVFTKSFMRLIVATP